jgi:hypothetical protein
MEFFLDKILEAVDAEEVNIIKPLEPSGIKKLWVKIER